MWLGHCCKKGTALSNHCSLPFVCGALGTELSPGTCMQGKHSAAELHAYLDFSFCCCNFYCFFLRQRLEKTGRLNIVKMTNLSNVIYIFNLALLEPQWMPPHPLTERISLCRSALKLSLCTYADQAGFESLAIPLPQPATCYIRLKVSTTSLATMSVFTEIKQYILNFMCDLRGPKWKITQVGGWSFVILKWTSYNKLRYLLHDDIA